MPGPIAGQGPERSRIEEIPPSVLGAEGHLGAEKARRSERSPGHVEGLPLQQRRAQSLRRPVHRGGQAGRAGSHDHHVIRRLRRPDVRPERLGHLCVRGVGQHRAGVERHHGPGGPAHAEAAQGRAALRGVGAVEPERDVVAGQQVAELVDPGRRLLSDDGHRLEPPAPLAPPLLQ